MKSLERFNGKVVLRREHQYPWVIDDKSYERLDFNNFDYTWAYKFLFIDKNISIHEWNEKGLNYRYENDKHVFDISPVENPREEAKHLKFTYSYNSHFFRCDEFKKNHDGLHIVFGGCSNTEGVGSSEDKMWSHMLYNKIKEKNLTSGYYNLGKSGHGWHKVIHQFRVYVKNYGAPDYFFILLPNLMRSYHWDDKNRSWFYWQSICFDENELPPNIKNFMKEQKSMDDIINSKLYVADLNYFLQTIPVFLLFWLNFIDYCNAIGTKIIWSTWDTNLNLNVINSNMFNDSFIETEVLDLKHIKKKRDGLELRIDDIDARDTHPGLLQNELWFEGFYQKLKDMKYDNLIL